ncbi:tyrosine-type recombinase/integrase [Shewanella marisflavi]|uniref:tyrosine-type recombinase/integrase n=1 Tax=Shewanella marisflavi TaxID=260364 RepID=UPI003AAA5D44
MNASNPALKQLFAELTDYSWADSLQEGQRDPTHTSYQGTMFEAMEDDVRDSLRNGGGKYEPSDYGLKTIPPTDISLRRDFENLALTLSEAMVARIVNGRSETFEELFNKAKALSEANVGLEKPYLLSEAWKDFKEYKSDWTHKTSVDNQRLYEVMLAFWGDVDVKTITKQMIKALLSRYEDFPKGNIKPYNNMSVKEIMAIDEEDIKDGDKVSSKRVKGLLMICQSFFSSFLTSEKDIYTVPPTSTVKYDSKSVGYASFSDVQIKKIKKNAVKLEGWKKWTILLAIYTGARRADIIGLTCDSLKVDDDTGRYYLWIDSGKTDAATRPIPIHQNLIDLGFIRFIEGVEGSLFPEISHHHNLLTYHARALMDSVEIPSKDEKGQRYTLHSFRHTFITKVQECGVTTSLFQSVVGHEKSELGISNRYTHDFKVKSLFCVVDAITDW